MKRIAALLILMGICLVSRYALNYWLGYYEQSYLPLVWQLLLGLIGFVVALYLLFIWIISLVRRNQRLWTTGMLVVLLVLVGIEWILPPRDMITYGLRDRLARDYSLEELRRFTKDIDQTLPQSYQIPGGSKTFNGEDLAKTGLKEKYPFLSWIKETHSEGPAYVSEKGGVVNVRWGSSFLGRWGFSVAVNAGKLDLPSEPGTKALRLSDDIIVVSEPD